MTRTTTDTRPYLHARAVSLAGRADGAGSIVVSSDGSVLAPQPWLVGKRGVSLGPLHLTPYPGTTPKISRLRFPIDDDGGGLRWPLIGVLPLLGVPAAADDPDTDAIEGPVTRRDVLVATGVALGLGGVDMATAETTQAEVRLLEVARVDVESNPRGIGLGITDIVQDALPTNDQTYHVSIDGERIDSFTTPEKTVIPPGETGTVRLATERRGGWWESVRGLIGGRQELVWEFELKREANSYGEGARVVITAEPLVVRTVSDAGDGDTTFTIGDRSIPHANEGKDESGWYEVDNDRIEYHTGPEPPESADVTLTVRGGTAHELLDDLSRSYL